jgi:hypothetical protein
MKITAVWTGRTLTEQIEDAYFGRTLFRSDFIFSGLYSG